MESVYKNIIRAIANKERLLVILIDPDKVKVEIVHNQIKKVNASGATHIFVGGSSVLEGQTDAIITEIKKYTILPIIIFPGDVSQISNEADALLFLSLISGRNPDYLIGKHVESIAILRSTNLEIIPTGYILLESGTETAVQRVTRTKPMACDNVQKIVDTAKAAELLGMQLIYLEAGSGAQRTISLEIIERVKQCIDIPLIVGGGIRSSEQLESAYKAGADVVVVGTAFEEDQTFFETIKRAYL